MGAEAHKGAVRERQNIHGLQRVEDRAGQVGHPSRLEVAAFHGFGLGIHFQEVNRLAPRVEPDLRG